MSPGRSLTPKRAETLGPDVVPRAAKGTSARVPAPTRRHTTPVPVGSSFAANPKSDFNPKADDIIILVMGASGSGKSSFINAVTGQKEAAIGNDLHSLTQEVRPFRCRSSSLGNVVLVDTPGFADTARSDADVLETITTWLTSLMESGGMINGLLFFHRISDVRMSGQSLRNLTMFQKLCGTEALANVVLVTTMWDTVDQKIASNRESELKEDFWKTLLEHGAQVARVNHKSSSARQVVDLIRKKPKVVLQIQQEVVIQRKCVLETEAGAVVADTLARLTADHRKTLAALEAESQSAIAKKDMALRRRIAEERLQYTRLLNETVAARDRLAKSTGVSRPIALPPEHSRKCWQWLRRRKRT